jgi:hypothetical protein
MLRAGASRSATGRALGVHAATVSTWAKRAGLPSAARPSLTRNISPSRRTPNGEPLVMLPDRGPPTCCGLPLRFQTDWQGTVLEVCVICGVHALGTSGQSQGLGRVRAPALGRLCRSL